MSKLVKSSPIGEEVIQQPCCYVRLELAAIAHTFGGVSFEFYHHTDTLLLN